MLGSAPLHPTYVISDTLSAALCLALKCIRNLQEIDFGEAFNKNKSITNEHHKNYMPILI